MVKLNLHMSKMVKYLKTPFLPSIPFANVFTKNQEVSIMFEREDALKKYFSSTYCAYCSISITFLGKEFCFT
jgi:hypothetical protein